jgi:hypothetical protein
MFHRRSECPLVYLSAGFSFACIATKSCYLFQENTQSTKTTNDNNEIDDITKSLKVQLWFHVLLILFILF